MNDPEPRSDEELADAVARGDGAAAAALIRRYADTLYDFASRTTLDAGLAAASVEAAFRRAWDAIGARPALVVRSWLLALARDEALEAIRQRGRPDATDNALEPLSPVDDRFIRSGDASVDEDVALWAWQAARGQRPRDYCFLDLALRRDLAPQEIGDIGSLSRTGVYGVLGRLRGAFEESFVTSALYHRGREQCTDLDALVRAGSAGLAPALRREINQHAEGCAACGQTRAGLPVAADVFAGLREVEPDAELRERLLLDASAAAAAMALAGPTQLGLEDAATAPADIAEDAATTPEVEDAAVVDAEEDAAEDAGEAAVIAAGAGLVSGQLLEEIETLDQEDSTPPGTGRVDDDSGLQAEEDDVEREDAAQSDLLKEDEDGVSEDSEETGGAEDESFLPLRDAFGRVDARDREPAGMEPPSEEPPPFEPDEQDQDRALVPGALAMSATTPAAAANDQGRIRFAGDVVFGMPPPRRPWDKVAAWFREDDKRSTVLFAFLGAMTLGFAYLGFVLGSSIEGGGGDGGEIPALPTRASGVREIPCGTTPTTLDQGARATLTFDAKVLPGYQVSAVNVRAASPEASAQNVEAKAQEGLSVLFEARQASGTGGRTDTYQLTVTFAKGEERTVSECTVLVRAPAVAPTVTPPPASPTIAPTATRTPAPVVPTSPPVIVPTNPPPPPPTATRGLCTPTAQPAPIGTPPTPFPFPTFTPIPVPCP